MNKAVIKLLFTGLFIMPIAAMASVIPYNSFSGTTIDFNSLSASPNLGSGEVVDNQFSGAGVTFNVQNFNAYSTSGNLASAAQLNSDPALVWVNQGSGSGGPNAKGITINFSSAQSKVGLWIGGSVNSAFTLAAYSGATFLESVTSSFGNSGSYLEGFLALSNLNITQVIAFSTNQAGQNWNFAMDDLKFSAASTTPARVPEPNIIMLLAIGIAAIGFRRKKIRSL